jgi:hypothetical protein
MKGLTCSILEPKDIGNCSNHGISFKCKSVTLLGIRFLDGTFAPAAGIFEPCKLTPPVVIVEREPVWKNERLFTAYPCNDKGEQLPGWWMFGGCYIKTSDSRFPFHHPVALHDRQE